MKLFLTLLSVGMLGVATANAQRPLASAQKDSIEARIRSTIPGNMQLGEIKVLKATVSEKRQTVNINMNEVYSYVPFTETTLSEVKSLVLGELPSKYKSYTVKISIKGVPAERYIPVFTKAYRKKNEKFIVSQDPNDNFTKGLSGNIIALWQSHGWYFEPKLDRWEWQRARIFQTVEDLYTQSYVMPFLMPMLENAGAYVMSPRERDINTFEQIIDGEGKYAYSGYQEHKKGEKWYDGSNAGFAYERAEYRNFENPFKEGTYREAKTSNNKDKVSTASWSAEVPKDGNYAVYISYATTPKSVSDVRYTINSQAGSKEFVVNQKMGGGTWLYLGHYPLKAGLNENVVEISNYSEEDGVVTADAVKIGGGIGNIARKVQAMSENVKSSDNKASKTIATPEVDYRWQLSNYPRFTEGARYFLQWAGVPDSVYSPTEGVNDYTDDYSCRGHWVNYLSGGSRVRPDGEGLNIPVDLAFAFHTDAGTTPNDSIIGTLGIYMTKKFDKYADGTPRILSRDFTNKVMTNIVDDVRRQFEPEWARRGMWDRSYAEARVPEVPTMLLELLSHQNFADMKYGLDPNFRFTVSRAIYKGMLQFLAKRDGRLYMVQPLPVNSFEIAPSGNNKFLLSWKPTTDTLTANSDASSYLVYERIGNGAFKFVAKTVAPQYLAEVNDNLIHSYKVVAMNDGGKSFPSEILSLGVAPESKGTVMVVNGFTRVSAPDWFEAGEIAGFYDERDHGVPYVNDISFIGSQFEFRREIPWMDDDAAGFGASRSNYETKVIAGNTFDYPIVHGEAIMAAGYSFVSSSMDAFAGKSFNAEQYPVVDIIMGKQKEVKIGRGAVPNRYKTMSPELMTTITEYTKTGGNVMLTGSFIATDIWDKKNAVEEEKAFAADVLGYKWRVGQAAIVGKIHSVPSIHSKLSDDGSWTFGMELNDKIYAVDSPDAIYPADTQTGATVFRYTENNIPAGIASSTYGYKTFVLGVPFEVIKGKENRNAFMQRVLNFFEK